MTWIELLLLFPTIGLIGGLCVGLVGIGSTLLVLPTLLLLFPLYFPAEVAVKMAIATSLACAMVGALQAAVLRIRQRDIRWSLFTRMSCLYVITAVLGVYLVHYLPARSIEAILGVALMVIALTLVLRKQPPAVQGGEPEPVAFYAVMTLAGFSNSVCGIATGTIAIPYLSRFYPYGVAIGTSVASTVIACGLGAVLYAYSGWHVEDMPRYAAGYVYLPAFAFISPGILVGTWLGTRWSANMPPTWIKTLLALLVATVGLFALVKASAPSVLGG